MTRFLYSRGIRIFDYPRFAEPCVVGPAKFTQAHRAPLARWIFPPPAPLPAPFQAKPAQPTLAQKSL
jgi:hypothetical protein